MARPYGCNTQHFPYDHRHIAPERLAGAGGAYTLPRHCPGISQAFSRYFPGVSHPYEWEQKLKIIQSLICCDINQPQGEGKEGGGEGGAGGGEKYTVEGY